MELKILENNSQKIAELVSDKIEINNVQDVLDLMANTYGEDIDSIVIYEKNLCPEFFDLKTKLAGEILQKFVNYKQKLSIVGDFSKYKSDSLNALILECNRGSQIFFTPDIDTAVQMMAKLKING